MNSSTIRLRLAVALLAVLGAACNDSPAAPSSGTVRVAVRTSGGDPDFDGYQVVIDPARRPVDATGTVEFRYIGAGVHTVALEGVAGNCTVVGAASRSVNVPRNRPVDITFDVVCAATGIAVTTRTTGVDVPDTVDVIVNGESFGPSLANGLTVATRLQPGKYTVVLAFRGTNCTVAGGNEVTIDVSSRTVTPVLFEATCTAPVRREKIAFAVDTMIRGATETLIELVDPDGSDGRVIGRGHEPAWSSDGKRVVFSDARCGPNDEGYGCTGGLVVVDPELGSLTFPPYAGQGFSPAWAPARDSIAFVGCCDAGLEPGRLFIVGLDASPARELSLSEVRSIRHPVWSPDGQRIAFTCVVEQFNEDLCVVDSDGSRFERLTSDLAPESDPAWSPDGARIAFTRGTDIVLLDLGDGVVTRLTGGREPAWSPDGSALVFAGGDGLFVINADGSSRRRLTTGVHRAPAWRP